MKKLLIASAVSAAFAAPTVALGQAARAPTLSQVLDASGLNVSGYLDAGYSYANRNVEAPGAFFSNRVFDSQNNSFALHQFEGVVLRIEHPVGKKSSWGFDVSVGVGIAGVEVPAHVEAGSIEHLREGGSPGGLAQRHRGSRERGRDC